MQGFPRKSFAGCCSFINDVRPATEFEEEALYVLTEGGRSPSGVSTYSGRARSPSFFLWEISIQEHSSGFCWSGKDNASFAAGDP